MKQAVSIFAVAVLLLSGVVGRAAADETVLNFATTQIAGDENAVDVFFPWAKRVNDAGKGVVRIDVREGVSIANASNVYDRVQNDVVQIGLLIPSLVGGKFPLTDVASLPFVTDDAKNASIAFWRLYKSGMLDTEYKDIALLGVGLFPPQGVHTVKPMASLDNLNGLRLRVVSKVGSQAVSRLGGTPQVLDPADQYSGLQRGALDGVVASWFGIGPLHLTDVTSFHLETSLGTGMFVVFMTRAKHDALPAEARKILDDNSGASLSEALGADFDKQSEDWRRPAAANPDKHKIVQLSPQQQKEWADKITPVVDDWTAAHPGGAKILETYRALIADVKAGK